MRSFVTLLISFLDKHVKLKAEKKWSKHQEFVKRRKETLNKQQKPYLKQAFPSESMVQVAINMGLDLCLVYAYRHSAGLTTGVLFMVH